MTKPYSHREKDDHYVGEIFHEGRNRAIICKDALQWIVQKHRGGPEERWVAIGYRVTRKVLLTLWTASTGGVGPEVACLPEQIGFQYHG